MWSDYFFYLMELPAKERNTQIIVFMIFCIIMFLVSLFAEYVEKLLH